VAPGVGVEPGVGVASTPISSVVVATSVPSAFLAEIRLVPTEVELGIGNETLNAPLAEAVNVASLQPLMVRSPALPAVKPLPETVTDVPGLAYAGTTRVAAPETGGGAVAATLPMVSVVVASNEPELVFAEIRPVLPIVTLAGIVTAALNEPAEVAVNVAI
jgi:hypothetical protein